MRGDGFDDLRFAGAIEASLNTTKAFCKAEECELFVVAVRKDGTFAYFADCTNLLNRDFMLQATQHCVTETQKAKEPQEPLENVAADDVGAPAPELRGQDLPVSEV